jgi:hypothetical protein
LSSECPNFSSMRMKAALDKGEEIVGPRIIRSTIFANERSSAVRPAMGATLNPSTCTDPDLFRLPLADAPLAGSASSSHSLPSLIRVTGPTDFPYPSAQLSAAIRRRRQGIGAAALACVGTARRLTGKAVGACATVLRRRTCHDCRLFARARMPLMSHGSHRSMGIGEAKEQQADPDHLWGVSLVRHVLHGYPPS